MCFHPSVSLNNEKFVVKVVKIKKICEKTGGLQSGIKVFGFEHSVLERAGSRKNISVPKVSEVTANGLLVLFKLFIYKFACVLSKRSRYRKRSYLLIKQIIHNGEIPTNMKTYSFFSG